MSQRGGGTVFPGWDLPPCPALTQLWVKLPKQYWLPRHMWLAEVLSGTSSPLKLHRKNEQVLSVWWLWDLVYSSRKKVSEATHACIKVIISSGCRVCLFPLGPYPISSFLLPHGAIRLKERLPHHLKMKVKVAQSCLTLWNPMNCIGWILAWILQARILQW